MRLQGTQYFQRLVPVPNTTTGDMAEYDIRIVPLVVGSLETRKARSFFASEADWQRGTLSINRLQESILMGAKEDLIREIRGARGNKFSTVYDTTLAAYPVGSYPGASLNDVLVAIKETPESDSVNEQLTLVVNLLTEIRDGGGTAEDFEGILTLLGQIAGFLA